MRFALPLLLLSCAEPWPLPACHRQGAAIWGATANCDRVGLAIEGSYAGARWIYGERGALVVQSLQNSHSLEVHAVDAAFTHDDAAGWAGASSVRYATRNECAEWIVGHELGHVIGFQLGEPDAFGHDNPFLFGPLSVSQFGIGAVRAECER